LGGRYSFAETATTPFLRRSLMTLPHFKKVDPAAMVKEKGLERIRAWIQVLCKHVTCAPCLPQCAAICREQTPTHVALMVAAGLCVCSG
jgi:hypothetical protein